jgi:hypothetical protein
MHSIGVSERSSGRRRLVSIGGNDACFGEVGRICVLPVDCSRIGERWLTNLETDVAPNVRRR